MNKNKHKIKKFKFRKCDKSARVGPFWNLGSGGLKHTFYFFWPNTTMLNLRMSNTIREREVG